MSVIKHPGTYVCDICGAEQRSVSVPFVWPTEQTEGRSCDPFEWTCARCGKTYTNPFFTCYPREFWKDNKKRVGEVCEECRDEVDYSNVRRRKAVGE